MNHLLNIENLPGRYCENDKSIPVYTCKTTDQILEELQQEEKQTKQQKYQQLSSHEESIYIKTKPIVDQRKSINRDLIFAYLINSIRKGEPDNYIEAIAKDYQQDLEAITKITNLKYLVKCKDKNSME